MSSNILCVGSRWPFSCRAIFRVAATLMLLATLSGSATAWAQSRVLSEGELPPDARLEPLRNLNGYFPFAPPDDAKAWPERAEEVRTRILVSQGLWPEPVRSTLREKVYGKLDCGDFTVEKVHFESWPNFYVTGTLYRPKVDETQAGIKRPGILCPHGHWTDARFLDKGEATANQEIAQGAEFEMSNARNHYQARCVQLARMGCVVLQYDMIGNSDSKQIAHRPGVRDAMNTTENWGFFSPQAELRLQSMMGLQTWNSIRAVDFLLTLPDVDPERIAVTGASGGGTQSMILSAVDPRVAASMPAVMVSTAMQGGCTCENADYLRIGTGNVEFAALFAPKPLGLTSADDWTKELSSKGLPELKSLYALLGAPDNLMLSEHTEFGHNYNAVNRAAMYKWFNQHLNLGLEDSQLQEQEHRFLTKEDLTVWDRQHPAPLGGDDFERRLLTTMTTASDRQLREATPKDDASLANFQRDFGAAWQVLLGANGLPAQEDVTVESLAVKPRLGYMEVLGLLKNAKTGSANPTEILMPVTWTRQVVIWVGGRGRASLHAQDGSLRPEVQQLLDAGIGVVGLDLFMQGEYLAGENPDPARNRINAEGNDPDHTYAAYTYGYNSPLFAQRTQDVLAMVSYLIHHDREPQAVHLAGVEGAGPIALAARAIAGESVTLAAVDMHGFSFGQVNSLDDPNFLPGAVKYADVAGLMALNSPLPLWVSDADARAPTIAISSYRLAKVPGNLVKGKPTDAAAERTAQAARWLLEQAK